MTVARHIEYYIPGEPGPDLLEILYDSLGTVRYDAAGGPINWLSLSTASGDGLCSRDRHSGVTTPLILPLPLLPKLFGEAGADLELFTWLRKHDIGRCLRLLNACSTSFGSDDGSIFQNDPLPGSSLDRATLLK